MHPEAERLAEASIRHFWAADHEIQWTGLEQELTLQLAPDTLLIGKIDAQGVIGGDAFFADWKTASKRKARYMESEKSQWRMNPQALTYGVLVGDAASRFMVRWALKTTPAACDHEWYTYTQAELVMWREQLIDVADQIRYRRQKAVTPWPLNLGYCTKFGEAYACPFRDDGCWKTDFTFVPAEMLSRRSAYGDGASHLSIEGGLRDFSNPNLVIIDASRVGDWMGCPEFYRRKWEGEDGGLTEENENLTIGTDFHSLIAAHLKNIKESQNG